MDQSEAYKNKVWKFLEAMEPDQSHSVVNLAKPENRKEFIAAVKSYMDATPWQGWLSFNSEYTKFYKTHPIIFEEELKIRN